MPVYLSAISKSLVHVLSAAAAERPSALPLAAGSLGKVLTAQLAGEGQPRTLGTPAFGRNELGRRHVIALGPKGFRQEKSELFSLIKQCGTLVLKNANPLSK